MFDLNTQQLFMWIVRGIVLFTALPVHEYAHAYAAYKLGDDTAMRQGRLTINPFVHLDLLGSILLLMAGFGWAKPVPVDPRRFRNPRRDMAITAIAGPLSNIMFALLLLIIFKIFLYTIDTPALRFMQSLSVFVEILFYMLTINLYLAVFNLLPVPPLDGSKILGALLPEDIYFTVMKYERYVIIVLFILIWNGVLTRPLRALAGYLYSILDLLTKPVEMLLRGLGV